MISASTKEGFTIALQAAKYIVLSVAVDVLKPVFVYCAESLHSVQPHPQKEVEPEVAQVTDPAEVRDVAEEDQPPHFVVARIRRCTAPERRGKNVCQLRRHDNNAWLWTSTPYVGPQPALRDARRAAARFGWEITSTNYEEGSAEDGEVDDEVSANRTIASIVDCVVKADAKALSVWDAVDRIAEVIRKDQGLLGQRSPFSAKMKEDILCPECLREAEDIDRAFDRGAEESRKQLEAIAQFVRAARDGKEAHADVLGEIAVVLETALEMDNCVLWPDRDVPASGPDRKELVELIGEYSVVCNAMWNWLAAEADKNPGKNWVSALMFLQAIYTRELGAPVPASCSPESQEWLMGKVGNATRLAIIAKTADYQARAASAFQGKEKS